MTWPPDDHPHDLEDAIVAALADALCPGCASVGAADHDLDSCTLHVRCAACGDWWAVSLVESRDDRADRWFHAAYDAGDLPTFASLRRPSALTNNPSPASEP